MPRTLLDSKNAPPPIDWVHAAILERKAAYNYDLKKLATVAGCSYSYVRRIINKPTSCWPTEVLNNVCREFGIKIVPVVNGESPEGVKM